MNSEFEELTKLSISNPDQLWDKYAKNIVWDKPYVSVIENKESIFPKWFAGGKLNMSYNCLDINIKEGHGDDIAIIFESPASETSTKMTYNQLLESVELIAGVMVYKCCITKDDKVFFFMPMIPQCLIAMLACTRIGALYTIAFGGFAAKEIASRIAHFEPKLIFTANVGINPDIIMKYKEKIDLAIEIGLFRPSYCIVYNRPNYEKASMTNKIDLDWESEITNAKPCGSIPLESDHPMFISYTSGTTGEPKAFVTTTAGSVVMNKYCMKYQFGLKSKETVFVISNFCWLLGQTVLSFGSLMNRNPTIIYEGKPACGRKESSAVIRIIKENNVTLLVCTTTIMKTLAKFCQPEDFDFPFQCLKQIHITAEYMHSSVQKWISETFKCQVYNSYGQTELGGFVTTPNLGYEESFNESNQVRKSKLNLGFIGKIVDRDSGLELPNEKSGRLILKLPLNPIRAASIYKNDFAFSKIYFSRFPGYFDTMDNAVILSDKTLEILSRDDNTIMTAGCPLDGFVIENVCLENEDISEVSVVSLDDEIKGSLPFAFVVPRNLNYPSKKLLVTRTKAVVMDVIGEFACFQHVVVVPNLPKNIAGKTLRKSLELMLNGKESKIPIMVENGEIYKIIYDILIEDGYHPCLPQY